MVLIKNYIKENEKADAFLKNGMDLQPETFYKFLEQYEELEKSGGSKFSERVFAGWLETLLGEKAVLEPHKKIESVIPNVYKNYDFLVSLGSLKIIIELKCNIDMIEKDIFKFVITPSSPSAEIIKILLVWEKWDNSKARNGDLSSYMKIANHAKEKGWINAFFYLRGYDRKSMCECTEKSMCECTELKKEINDMKEYIKKLTTASTG